MRPTFAFLILLSLPLAACGTFPEDVGAVVDDIKNAPYPEIQPVAEVLTPQTTRLTDQSDDELTARERRLRRRAAALQ